MRHIIAKIDGIADTLQGKGLEKEASQLDVVSNTIEGFFKAPGQTIPGEGIEDIKSQDKARKDIQELGEQLSKVTNPHDRGRILQDVETLKKRHGLKG